MRRKRSSDEYLGFAPPTKAVTQEAEPLADDPGSYVDSWYQVLKGVGENDDADLSVEDAGDAEPEER